MRSPTSSCCTLECQKQLRHLPAPQKRPFRYSTDTFDTGLTLQLGPARGLAKFSNAVPNFFLLHARVSETALPASSTSEKTISLLNRHFRHRIDEVAEKEEEDEGVEYDDTPGPKVVTTDEVDDENNDASDGDHL